MPKRISIDTYGMREDELLMSNHSDFLQSARERGLTNCQINRLKAYRRLLKVREYGKEFRKREREELRRLREAKFFWQREADLVRQEIEWYKEQSSVLETLELFEQFNSY